LYLGDIDLTGFAGARLSTACRFGAHSLCRGRRGRCRHHLGAVLGRGAKNAVLCGARDYAECRDVPVTIPACRRVVDHVARPRRLSITEVSFSQGRDDPDPSTEEETMLEYFLRSAYWLARARSSPVGSYLDGFAAALREIGYWKRIGTWCITYAVHLGIWATGEDVRIGDLDEETVSAFLAHLSRCRCPGNRAGFHAVARLRTWVFVQYLRTVGVVAVPGQQAIATPDLVTGFCKWMRRQRGATDTTLRHYRRVAIPLLGHLGDDPARYGAGVLRAKVREVVGGHGAATAKQVATVARAFLRYLAVEGRYGVVAWMRAWARLVAPRPTPPESREQAHLPRACPEMVRVLAEMAMAAAREGVSA
jgi:hypothetical protein